MSALWQLDTSFAAAMAAGEPYRGAHRRPTRRSRARAAAARGLARLAARLSPPRPVAVILA